MSLKSIFFPVKVKKSISKQIKILACTLIIGLKATEAKEPNQLADLDLFSYILRRERCQNGLEGRRQAGAHAKKESKHVQKLNRQSQTRF